MSGGHGGLRPQPCKDTGFLFPSIQNPHPPRPITDCTNYYGIFIDWPEITNRLSRVWGRRRGTAACSRGEGDPALGHHWAPLSRATLPSAQVPLHLAVGRLHGSNVGADGHNTLEQARQCCPGLWSPPGPRVAEGGAPPGFVVSGNPIDGLVATPS